MPPSMRAQTLAHNARLKKREEEKDRRAKAPLLIQKGESALKVSTKTGVSRTTTTRIKKLFVTSKQVELEKLLEPVHHHAGRKTVLSPDEEKLVVKRTLHAAARGFAVDNTVMTTVHARIAAYNGHMYANGVPSPDAIRSFRARNRSLAHRVAENVTGTRLAAQNKIHIESLKHALQEVEQLHPGILADANRIWNWDETSVSGEYGRKIRCYASASTHSGGARRSVRDAGKHVTAGIAVSASGNVAPLFVVATGKRVVKTWRDPLQKQDFTNSLGVPHWLCEDSWLPPGTAIHVTKSGSVDRNIIVKIAEHVNAHARKTISSDKHIVLLVDGHSSRDGWEWIETCQRLNIIVVRLPANTTHILQPCDQLVNKAFQRTVRKTRDELLAMAHLSWANTSYKIKLAVAGHQAITPSDARLSFVKCEIWPMNFRFVHFALSSGQTDDSSTEHIDPGQSSAHLKGISGRFTAAKSHNSALQSRIHRLTDGRLPTSRALSKVAALIQTNYRVNTILQQVVRAPKSANCNRKGRKNGGVMQKAKVLTSRGSKTSSRDEQLSNSKLEAARQLGVQVRELFNRGGLDKENVGPVGLRNVSRDAESSGHDCLDNIPISQWCRRLASGASEQGRGRRTDSQHDAARSLLGLSQLR